MANQEFYSRIIHKHDTEENWIKATNFIPKQGEIIVYDIDNNHNYERIKIGDGTTKVNTLPFIDKTLADLIGTKDDTVTVDTAFGRIAQAQATAEAAQGSAENATNNSYISASISGKTITLTKGDGSTKTLTTQDTTYSAAGTSLGLVKSGGDVTISSGTITVNDDSHNHIIANIDGLSGQLTNLENKTSNNETAIGTPQDTGDVSGSLYARVIKAQTDATSGINKADTAQSGVNTLNGLVGTKSDTKTTDTAFGRIAKAQAAAEAAAGAAQAAQNAADSHKSFSTVKVGNTSISADNISDTLTFVAGSNVSITPDAANDKITINVPTASGTVAGATIVYPAASCTTFSSDSGTVTPLAVQKGAKMFAITRPSSTTNKTIVRYSNTIGDVQDSKIIIEDVTNTRDTSKEAQVIAIPAEGGKKMVYGYCTDQVDGTSFLGGLFDQNATEYPYSMGLAISGSSGNLLWKGNKVATVNDIPADTGATSVEVVGSGNAITTASYNASTRKLTLTKGATYNNYSLPAATSSTLGGVKIGSNITNSSGTISLTKANVTAALGYTPPTTDTNTTYSAGTGISLSGTTFSNSGVRSITTGTSNGTISVNTNGTSADVAVKGLGSAAYTNSTAYATAAQGTLASNAMPKAGGSFTGTAYAKSQNTTEGCLRNISIRNAAGNSLISTNYLIMLRK